MPTDTLSEQSEQSDSSQSNLPEADAAAVVLDHATSGAPEVETAEDLAARAPVRADSPTFAALGVRQETVQALLGVGIEHTFAIQELTLPIAMAGHDLIGQARTGTGKTLGFGVPLLERVLGPDEGADGVPQALIVVPTRELCVQVSRDLQSAGRTRNIRVLSIYGGRAYEPQVEALRRGVDVVVGTPGRLIDLAEQRKLVLGKVGVLILDEADEMLDLGFLPDVEKILRMVPDERQTMLFSATMPGPIVTLARRFMRQPTHIRAELPSETATVPTVRQLIYRAHALDKVEMLARIMQAPDRSLALIFTRTKRTAQKVADDLVDRGFAAAAVHGDLGQGAREQALRAFRSGKVDVLVATDVAARGLDIEGISHVINYQCPEDEKTYLHRIGRTARAGADGVAITLVDWDDLPRWTLIDTALSLGIPEPVETYSTSAHLLGDLSIPASVGSRLPRNQRTRPGLEAEAVEDIGETGRGDRHAGPGRRHGRHDGGSARGGSDESGASGSSGRSTGANATADGTEARPPREHRPRRRTRGGGPAAAAVAEDATTATADAGASSGAPAADGTAPARSRRRRRGGRSRGAGSEPTAEAGPGTPADRAAPAAGS